MLDDDPTDLNLGFNLWQIRIIDVLIVQNPLYLKLLFPNIVTTMIYLHHS